MPKTAMVTVLMILLASSVTAWSAPKAPITETPKPNATDRMRKARIAECMLKLRADRSDRNLKDYWRGICRPYFVEEELSDAAEVQPTPAADAVTSKEVIAARSSCTAPLPYAPLATTPSCGMAWKTLQATDNAAVRIRLPGNTCGWFIPVLLANKNSPFSCNAVVSRIACIDVRHDERTDRTTIRMSTLRTRTADFTSFEIGAEEMAQTQGRLDRLIKHPQFLLIPEKIGKTAVIASLRNTADAELTACLKSKRSQSYCSGKASLLADVRMQELIRRYRNPRQDTTEADRNRGANVLLRDLRAAGIDGKIEQWLLFLTIAMNEVSLKLSDNGAVARDPIYGLSDPIADSGALSFGAHQIDLGANDGPDVALFWDVIRAYKKLHPAPIIDTAEAMNACIALPLRLMTVRALDVTYRTASPLNAALGSDDGMREYNTRFVKYLNDTVGKTNGLPGLFQKSMVLRIAYADRLNHFGSGKPVADHVATIEKDGKYDTETCAGLRDAEDNLIKHLIAITPEKYTYRYENVRKIVRNGAPEGGRTACR